jgi:uncharacterized protein (DUF1330 family)
LPCLQRPRKGLQAQSKPKAYAVSKIETLDAAAQTAYVPLILAAIKNAGGRNFYTVGGKTVAIIGVAPTV